MQRRRFFFSFLFSAVPLSQINRVILLRRNHLLCEITQQWRAGAGGFLEMHSLKTRCNYTGRLLTLGKNDEKWAPDEDLARGGAVNLCPLPVPQLPGSRENRGKTGRGGETRGGRKRTNALDFNKELSQQIAWPYISHAEALGYLPTGPEHSSALLGLPQDS